MKNAKRFTSLVLALLMLIGVFAGAPINASAKTLSADAKANWEKLIKYLKKHSIIETYNDTYSEDLFVSITCTNNIVRFYCVLEGIEGNDPPYYCDFSGLYDNNTIKVNSYDDDGEIDGTTTYSIEDYQGSGYISYYLEKNLNMSFTDLGFGVPLEKGGSLKYCTVDSVKPKTYNGKEQTPEVKVTDGAFTLINGTDYTVSYKNNKNAGTATMTITGKGDYTGSIKKTFKINKATNPIKVTAKKSVAANSKKKTTIKKAVTVKGAQGKVTYKTNNKKVTVKNGTITVAKGLKKGKTYKVKVTITATGSSNYKSASKSVTIKVKVK